MKGSEQFKEAIKAYLDEYAIKDPLFAVNSYSKQNKSLDECIGYIFSQVQKSGCNGFDDDEIYAMAVHYYDEDSIIAEECKVDGRVVVNHHVELTEEEKEEMRKKAKDDFYKQMLKEQRDKNSKPKVTKPAQSDSDKNAPQQLSLF